MERLKAEIGDKVCSGQRGLHCFTWQADCLYSYAAVEFKHLSQTLEDAAPCVDIRVRKINPLDRPSETVDGIEAPLFLQIIRQNLGEADDQLFPREHGC